MNKTILYTGLCVLVTACTSSDQGTETVRVDGSSTVYPIAEAMAEEFQRDSKGQYRVTVGVSGSGGGFKKFCRGEIDIANASRPISAPEREKCKENGVKFIELPVAMDALTVVVNKKNDWVQCMTVDELKTAWQPAAQGEVNNWNQIRDGFPDRPLKLYGPGADSGTYDYFTEAVVGEEGASRGDYQASEDDNVLVQGVASNLNALGFFGLAYYEENHDRLKALAIKNPNTDECVEPSVQTAKSGEYVPLARPMFMYVKKSAAENKESVRKYVDYFIDEQRTPKIVTETGYVPLPSNAYKLAGEVFANRELGTAFAGGTKVGVEIGELMKAQNKTL